MANVAFIMVLEVSGRMSIQLRNWKTGFVIVSAFTRDLLSGIHAVAISVVVPGPSDIRSSPASKS